jgi:phosphoribosyl-AMP cyclohydrolase
MQIPDNLKYDEKGLIPTVIQNWKTGDVLMVAYMNAESLRKTVESGLTCFWSRSRRKFWQKGETSGNVQRVKDILYDCDQDTLLIKVDPAGPACHTGERTCFYRSFSGNK